MGGKPVVTVFGATGAQGGSVVQELLRLDKYEIRAVTRDTATDRAISLSEKGVKLVVADMAKPEQVREAVDGAYAVFLESLPPLERMDESSR